MDQQTSTGQCSHSKCIVSSVALLVVGVLIGAYAGPLLNKANTYQAGFDAAKKRVEESSFGMMLRTPDDVRTLSGSVTAINGNRITLRTQSMNPFEDPSLLDRTVTVATDTKISKLSQKDPKVMQAEMEAFVKTMQSGKSASKPTTPPEPFTRTTATVADITVGDILNITAAENIKEAVEFSASEIQIQPKPAIK